MEKCKKLSTEHSATTAASKIIANSLQMLNLNQILSKKKLVSHAKKKNNPFVSTNSKFFKIASLSTLLRDFARFKSEWNLYVKNKKKPVAYDKLNF